MKFTATIAVTLLATFAAAETFTFFPKGDQTCKTKAAPGSETVSLAEMKARARTGKGKKPYEASAANIGTSFQCSKQKLPFFYTGIGKEMSMTFTYDKATDTYTLCGISTSDIDKSGYGDQCTIAS